MKVGREREKETKRNETICTLMEHEVYAISYSVMRRIKTGNSSRAE